MFYIEFTSLFSGFTLFLDMNVHYVNLFLFSLYINPTRIQNIVHPQII